MTEVSTQSLLTALAKAGLVEHPVSHSDTTRSTSVVDNPPAIRALCAVSGGLDSMVLLHLVKRSGIEVRAIHVDHAAHPESAKWAEWLVAQVSQMDVQLSVHRLSDTHSEGSLEEFWRDARRALYIDELVDDEVLLTAHHQDDQLETFLLQLFRGAGPTGLQSMPLSQELSGQNLPSKNRRGKNLHARPLLAHTRAELETYAHAHNIEYLDDPSNAQTRFDRNFIRHEIVPRLRERWPSVGSSVSRSAELIAESVRLNDVLANQDAQLSGGDNLDWDVLSGLDRARQANAVRFWIGSLDERMPSRRRLAEALRQWNEATEDRLPVLELGNGVVQRYRSRLVYETVQPEDFSGWQADLVPGQWLALPDRETELGLFGAIESAETGSEGQESGLVIQTQTLDLAKLTVRYRSNGEKLRRAAGHHQKLKHWFQQNDVPPVRRSRIPLLFLGQEMIAIGNYWLDARFRSEPELAAGQNSSYLIWRGLQGGLAK